jgi:predicted Rossmann fold nucleotide-binding protein DprA/Smf involved in DNA uptake
VLEAFGLAPRQADRPALSPGAEAVWARITEKPASADELVRALGLDAGTIAAALAELDLHELLTESSGIFRGATPP